MEATRKINFHLPRGWNQCTTDELEQIAALVAIGTITQNRYHPFEWDELKVKIVFALNKIEIVERPDEQNDDPDGAYIVRLVTAKPSWWRRLFHRVKNSEPFPLYVSQVQEMVNRLSWIDDEKAEPLIRFPYPTIKIKGKEIKGADPMLDGYTWEEYRYLQDWMSLYVKQSNILQKHIRNRHDANMIAASYHDVNESRANFLAVLFRQDVKMFLHFDDIQWQVILFFWSGLMRYLQRTYPKCFKPEDGKSRRKQSNPMELYARTTATLQKYIGLTEQEVNGETYTVTLRKLEMMAEESDAAKKMSQKYKHRK